MAGLDGWVAAQTLLPKRRQTLDRDREWDELLVRVVRGATEAF